MLINLSPFKVSLPVLYNNGWDQFNLNSDDEFTTVNWLNWIGMGLNPIDKHESQWNWPWTLGETDGIIRTFDLFTAYDPGYFMVEVLARDLAGHSDIAMVDIYILRDDQRMKIIINEIPERVQQFQEEFINLLSNITRAIVNTDDVQVGGVGGCGGCVCLCAGVCVHAC